MGAAVSKPDVDVNVLSLHLSSFCWILPRKGDQHVWIIAMGKMRRRPILTMFIIFSALSF